MSVNTIKKYISKYYCWRKKKEIEILDVDHNITTRAYIIIIDQDIKSQNINSMGQIQTKIISIIMRHASITQNAKYLKIDEIIYKIISVESISTRLCKVLLECSVLKDANDIDIIFRGDMNAS